MAVELFETVIDGVCVIGISRVSVASGASFELAVTILVRVPLAEVGEPLAFSSACVKVCVAVQVIVADTANVVAGQLISLLSLSSLKTTPVNITFPVFVTK